MSRRDKKLILPPVKLLDDEEVRTDWNDVVLVAEKQAELVKHLGSGQLTKLPDADKAYHKCEFPDETAIDLPPGTKWRCECGKRYRLVKLTGAYSRHYTYYGWRRPLEHPLLVLLSYIFLGAVVLALPGDWTFIVGMFFLIGSGASLFGLAIGASEGNWEPDLTTSHFYHKQGE